MKIVFSVLPVCKYFSTNISSFCGRSDTCLQSEQEYHVACWKVS